MIAEKLIVTGEKGEGAFSHLKGCEVTVPPAFLADVDACPNCAAQDDLCRKHSKQLERMIASGSMLEGKHRRSGNARKPKPETLVKRNDLRPMPTKRGDYLKIKHKEMTRLRKAAGITHATLYAMTGVNNTCRMESGNYASSKVETLKKIAEAIGCELSEIAHCQS